MWFKVVGHVGHGRTHPHAPLDAAARLVDAKRSAYGRRSRCLSATRNRGGTVKRRALLVLAAVTCGAAVAGATAGGLYAESATSVDGVTVRRVRDTEEGVVCYVASGSIVSDQTTSYSFRGRLPSISCVRTKGKDAP